jgi:hypothetical protein
VLKEDPEVFRDWFATEAIAREELFDFDVAHATSLIVAPNGL